MPSDSLERNKEGVPSYDGSAEKLSLFRDKALAYTFTLEHHKRYLAGARLAKELTGVARTVVRKKLAQDPQWLAHPRGAYVLIEYLEQAIETPTLVQASNHIHKFFYQLRRRKGETMTEWINRHSESMWEASRALKRVQKEHGTPSTTSTTVPPSTSSQQLSGGRFNWEPNYREASGQLPRHHGPVFDDNGLMAEEDDEQAEAAMDDHQSAAGWSHGWQNWNYEDWGQSAWSSWRSEEFQPPANWETDVQDFLPDFLTGFLLLNRSGLDAHERANILAAIRGEFSVKTVEKALREQWRDDDLARRDRTKQYANMAEMEEEQDDEAYTADMDAPDPSQDPHGYEAFMCDQREIDIALEAIRDKKRTLKEARWRQEEVKMNRKFYPATPYRPSTRPTPQAATYDTGVEKCLSCGGKHKTSLCPSKSQKANLADEEAEVAFSASDLEVSAAANHGNPEALTSNIKAGKAIIDCGATSTLGSVDALESLMKLNQDRHGRDRVIVDPSQRPTFKFGNNGTRDCISSVDLGVDLGGKMGKLRVHVHDIPNQPVLISVKALRKLGAVVDFSRDEILYKAIDPKAVAPLEVASRGHCLMPLGGDLLAGAVMRRQPFTTLAAE